MKIRLISTAASVAALLSVFASPVAFSAGHGGMIAEGKKLLLIVKKVTVCRAT